ncbi:cobalamin biosynthesis protein CobW [Jannaschia pagri]|uniref:Cobalamin biosynthesis protein CobW n=2 Tax=Jannaschia pagri TaxID=2829797 RepID=A0ABQ4NQ46_9RHOB|nr:GTP-binding protein [Jannaschia sp. AI_61]GIT92606.1 cobalamin biosynthesis protein CobW [Jannaschia sp. AI_61]GIT96534.1 cobalamin biosynthesis protein CobW [Jannaschia sp. AI_62]
MAPRSVPTLTVGGFLGAGKTTLVNGLLRQADGRRVVVFVNDFGAINIDHDLIETVEADRIALSNGCVCCSLNDDLIRSMVAFCDGDRPDLFVIEASGVADPRSLSSTLEALEAARHAHLRARLYVLDAAQVGGLGYADTEDLVDQAAASDLIVVNKSDLVSGNRLGAIEQLLDRSAPTVTRAVTSRARVSWKDVMGVGAQMRCSGRHQMHGHGDHGAFASTAFRGFPPLSEDRLAALVTLLKRTCLRAKGVLTVEGEGRSSTLLQLVGPYVEMTPVPPEASQLAQLVVIGWSKTLPTAEVSDLLQAEPWA